MSFVVLLNISHELEKISKFAGDLILGHGFGFEGILEFNLSGGDDINHVVDIPLAGGLNHRLEGSELVGKVGVLGRGAEDGDGESDESHSFKVFFN